MHRKTTTTLFPCTEKLIWASVYAPKNENADLKLF